MKIHALFGFIKPFLIILLAAAGADFAVWLISKLIGAHAGRAVYIIAAVAAAVIAGVVIFKIAQTPSAI